MTNTTTGDVSGIPAIEKSGHWRWIPAALLLAGLWAWAIAGCADEWHDNPMYSYGWFVPPLMLFFAWRRLDEPMAGREPMGDPRPPRRLGWIAFGALGLALLVLPVELLRNELPDDRLNNWSIAMVAVGATLWAAYWVGGWKLVWTLAFPVAFFLTAVAWPKRYEIPVTVGLQKFVAAVIVEVMHVMGVHAEPAGTTIYLRNGPVGIAEACSGVRSLQASLMISLAIGELFFLRMGRRLALVVISALIATVLNLGRTLALCLITEYRGADAMHAAHDYIGDSILLILPAMVWGTGWLLARGGGAAPTDPLPRRPSADGTPPPVPHWKRLVAQVRDYAWGRVPNFAPALVVGFAGFLTYHIWLMVLDRRNPPQAAPYFSIDTSETGGMQEEKINPEIWGALTPSSGGMYARRIPEVPGGRVHLYHFFWKPAAANRWVTGHRPDICMPAGGWKSDGPVEPVDIELEGRTIRMHAFRFASVGQRALQLWGIYRNGEAIQMEFFKNPTLEWSLLTGKSRSAVEVISCVVPYLDDESPLDIAREVLTSAVRYNRPDQAPAPRVASAPSGSAPSESP